MKLFTGDTVLILYTNYNPQSLLLGTFSDFGVLNFFTFGFFILELEAHLIFSSVVPAVVGEFSEETKVTIKNRFFGNGIKY